MKKQLVGILFGALAGVIDVIPMIIQKLPLSGSLLGYAVEKI